jgi:hypothetical protein
VSEIAEITRGKLVSLGGLYGRQMGLLRAEYKAGRKSYLKEVRALKEKLGGAAFTTDPSTISFDRREDVREEYLAKEVKAKEEREALLKNGRASGKRKVEMLKMMRKRQVRRRERSTLSKMRKE